MMAPYYFALWSPTERAVLNSAEVIERALWNVEIGGYIRHLPYSRLNGWPCPGPYPHFTAWMAQYHYAIGNQDRAEAIMRWLFDNAEDGFLRRSPCRPVPSRGSPTNYAQPSTRPR